MIWSLFLIKTRHYKKEGLLPSMSGSVIGVWSTLTFSYITDKPLGVLNHRSCLTGGAIVSIDSSTIGRPWVVGDCSEV